MKRKKAMVLHEMRTLRWFLIIGLVFLFLYGILLISAVETNLMHINEGVGQIRNLTAFGPVEAGSYFSISFIGILYLAQPILVFVFAFLTAIQFSESSKRKIEEFTGSLPYTRLELTMTKALMGASIITVLCFLLGMITFAIRGQYIDEIEKVNILSPCYADILANETPWHTLRTLLFFWVTLVVTYFIFVVAHCLIRNIFVAGLAGYGMVLAPVHLAFFMDYSLTIRNVESLGISNETWRMCNVFFGDFLSVNNREWFWYEASMDQLISYDNITFVVIMLMLILLISLLIIWYCCKKKDLAKDRRLVPILWLRIVLSLGIGYGLGTTGVMMYSDSNYLTFGGYLIDCLIVSAILAVITMLILRCKVK